ncbi:MAG TPA: TIGR03668 family PPOX class F420-dependent oxidoreductase [Actinospica sp.]|nr:TIGR03668 family PPOX class F420-dependent oxidoreductase [Actinospica sp.]
MEIPIARARSLFAAARVARLATADADGRPHLVPVTFVVEGESVHFAVDAKPKRTQQLRRLRNIEANPRVSLLVDEYDEDWERLWWVRADGVARIHHDGHARVVDLLRAKYPQYAAIEVGRGPVVEIAVERWSGWRSSALG